MPSKLTGEAEGEGLASGGCKGTSYKGMSYQGTEPPQQSLRPAIPQAVAAVAGWTEPW